MTLSFSRPPTPRVLIFAARPGDRYRAGRTLRALTSAGLTACDLSGQPPAVLADALAAGGPVWMLRAGGWPLRPGPIVFPNTSGNGRPFCGIGVPRPGAGAETDTAAVAEAAHWASLQAANGGDFEPIRQRLPGPVSAYLTADAAATWAEALRRGRPLSALHAEPGCRLVRVAALDVFDDPGLRVAQAVTSLQRGGAERIALELAAGLVRHSMRTLLVSLGAPTRKSFPVPADAIDLSRVPGGRDGRLAALVNVSRRFAADLLHAHLLDAKDAAALADGPPVVMTVHNVRPAWPRGLETIARRTTPLLLACSRAVEDELRRADVAPFVRTVWNGIDFAAFWPPGLREAAAAWRRRLGFGADDVVLLALANPRPQKRLHVLPEVLAALGTELARRGIVRRVRLTIAGEASAAQAAAIEAEQAIHRASERCHVAEQVRLVGTVHPVAPLLASATVLVSAAAHEGLSLAHLEALAAGIPVVATDVGGTREIAAGNAAFRLVPADATPSHFATVLADVVQTLPGSGRDHARRDFSHERMVERYASLYPRAIEAAKGPGGGTGIWLVCNNFSTGGAQSSARRLLLGLAAEGIRVRAAVLQEQPQCPTAGRAALTRAGIPVLALPPHGTAPPAATVAELLERMDADPPAAVLLWNALTEYKIRLADGLLGVPVFDVSPGAMYFEALQRYFDRPRPGLPYRRPAEYGATLAGVIVKYTAEADVARTLGAPVHVIPNGVPLPAPRPPRAPDGRLILGTAARISTQKKLEELLAALRLVTPHLPAHVLRIAGGVERGSETYAAELRHLAEGLSVEWVGETQAIDEFLAGLDVFVQVSEPAGCPNASLEALAAGLPVIATDVGGASEQVVDGVTGYLTPRGDPAVLASAMLELARDAGRRASFGAAGRAHIAAYFSLPRMVDDYRRICLSSR